MKVELTWEKYCQAIVRMEVGRYKSLCQFSNASGIQKSDISRLLNGKRIPSAKIMRKWFPYRNIIEPELVVKLDIPDENLNIFERMVEE